MEFDRRLNMNHPTAPPNTAMPQPLDPRLLDLLVDGELDDVRRAELLRQCEDSPALWRQCALTFLEAQAWRRDLHVAANESRPDASRLEDSLPIKQQRFRRWRVRGLLAATVACAFFAGWVSRPSPQAPQIADRIATAPDKTESQSAAPPSIPNIAESPAPAESLATQKTEPAAGRISGVLTLTFDDHGQKRQLRLPIIDSAGVDVEKWLAQTPELNAAAVQALERHGHKVESHRQLVGFNLKDGRRLVLPMDQVDVRLKHRVYQ
jgi:hypothetical protein